MNSVWSEWNDDEKSTFRNWLTSMLKMGGVELTFTKVDGSERVMKASLEEDKIPVYENKTGRKKTQNLDVVSVVDLDINEWRAVRYDSIKQIRITL